MTNLTAEDRDKFVAYLKESAASDEAMAAQCEALNERVMSKKLRVEAMAYRVVAAKLAATEFFTVEIADTH